MVRAPSRRPFVKYELDAVRDRNRAGYFVEVPVLPADYIFVLKSYPPHQLVQASGPITKAFIMGHEKHMVTKAAAFLLLIASKDHLAAE
jgi:hypothetical protein